MIRKAEYLVDSLIRLSGSKETSTGEKIKAKSTALHHMHKLAELLQSLGHLVSQPQKSIEDSQQKSLPVPPVVNILPVAVGLKKEEKNA